jgi:hypothetical protein
MRPRNKRHKGLYRSDPCYVPSLKIDGAIYNPFPYIDTDEVREGVQRAYYIPTIRSVYMPFEAKSPDFDSRVLHEETHRIVSDVVATCEVQFLIHIFLGQMMEFLELGCHLLVPSFTLVLPDGTTNDSLTNLAEQIEELQFTTGLIHEMVANAVQAEREGLDRNSAKENITKSVKEVCVNLEDTIFVKKFLTEQLLDEFLDVYNQVGMVKSWLLGRYVLNRYRLSREIALKRLQQALQIARGFQGESDAWADFLAFTEYLNQNLPDFNEDRCPLEKNCLASKLESIAQLCPPDMSSSDFMLKGARIMRYLGCEHKQFHPWGDVGISDIGVDVLRAYIRAIYRSRPPIVELDEEGFLAVIGDSFGFENFGMETQPHISLSLMKAKANGYRVFPDINRIDETVARANTIDFVNTLLFESLWEQLSQGEGPYCYCEPDFLEDCPYQPVLAKVWQQTKPDTDWEQNWKPDPKNPPECIRPIIWDQTATAVHSLLMSRTLEENEKQSIAGRCLRTYQQFISDTFDREIYFGKEISVNDLLIPWSDRILIDGVPVIDFEANTVRIAGLLYSTDDDKLVCYLEDAATRKEVTVQVTEKDENGNEQQVEFRVEPSLKRELVANLQLVAAAPWIKSLFSEEEQELIDVHIHFFLSQN